MTEARPAPLTPADCELQDFKFMPLDVARLRSSEQNSDVTPEANWAALQLWAASWHEVPAASIPDNDGWIAKACGYVSRGTVDQQWEIVRAGAMRKFVLCSDGRMYHPVVAEKALEAWAAKLEQRWKTECARIKKHNDRHELKGDAAVPKPSYDEWIAAGRPAGHPLPVPSDTNASPKGQAPTRPRTVPGDKHSKGQRQGQGQGQRNSTSSPAAPTTVATWDAYSAAYELVYRAKPVRNAKVNALLKQFVERIGADEAPAVAAFFLSHQNTLYVRACHPVDLLLRDAEGLRTQWATGRTSSDRPSHTAETPWQRSQRERVAEATGGLASARNPEDHDVEIPTTPALEG